MSGKHAVTILYPTSEKFNLDYYLLKHMPLCKEKWEKHGLVRWEVMKLDGKSGYAVQATLHFAEEGQFMTAVTKDGAEIQADVTNYTDAKAIALVGEVVGKAIIKEVHQG